MHWFGGTHSNMLLSYLESWYHGSNERNGEGWGLGLGRWCGGSAVLSSVARRGWVGRGHAGGGARARGGG